MILQVGVKVLLRNDQGNYLILKRNLEKYPHIRGAWDIVGGRIDIGTTLIDNLRREVREETALSITSEPSLIYAQDIIRDTEKHVVRLTYTADTHGEPTLDTTENIEYRWVSMDELRHLEDVDMYLSEILQKNIL